MTFVVPEDTARAEAANRIEIVRDHSHTRSLKRSEFDAIFAAAGLRVLKTELDEMPRMFDHWMHVAGLQPRRCRVQETRRLMEATMADDFAGFHPRYAEADVKSPGEPPDIHMVNTALFIAAEKI